MDKNPLTSLLPQKNQIVEHHHLSMKLKRCLLRCFTPLYLATLSWLTQGSTAINPLDIHSYYNVSQTSILNIYLHDLTLTLKCDKLMLFFLPKLDYSHAFTFLLKTSNLNNS